MVDLLSPVDSEAVSLAVGGRERARCLPMCVRVRVRWVYTRVRSYISSVWIANPEARLVIWERLPFPRTLSRSFSLFLSLRAGLFSEEKALVSPGSPRDLYLTLKFLRNLAKLDVLEEKKREFVDRNEKLYATARQMDVT